MFFKLIGWWSSRGACLAALLLLSPVAWAQVVPAPFPGTVRSAAGEALPYATVALHRASDSAVVKTEFTDGQGAFLLTPPAAGRYLLSVIHIGYLRAWAGPIEAGTTMPAVQRFVLTPSKSLQLGGVTVTGQKPLFERLSDRTVINVEGSIISNGSTALEVLGRSPGVTVDGNDLISLRGKQGVLLLLDGKRVPLTGTELAALLRALPAEQIRTIELITNPPAKYDAQGTAGIIAINLKKDARQGTNGSVNASYGRGKYGKATTGFALNYRNKTANLYGTYAYADRQNFQDLTFDRRYYLNGQLMTSSAQRNDMRNHTQSHTWKAGVDYTAGTNTVVGAMVSGLASHSPWTGTNASSFFNAENQLLRKYNSDNHRDVRTPNVAGNLTLRHTFRADSGAAAPVLTADADYARYGLTRDLYLATTFLEPARTPTLLTGDNEGRLTIQSLKTDYVLPMAGGLRLEAGAKSSWVTSTNDVLFVWTVNGVSIPDPTQSNHFRYSENINAAYVSLSRSRPGLTVTGGLRAEQTNATGMQEIGNENFDRHYTQLFPNLSLQRKLSEKHDLGFSLSRRIDRPTYNQLNPFRFYIDATSYRTGNPYLKPQTTYVAELNHTFNGKITTGLSYAYTKTPIVPVYVYQMNSAFLVAATDYNLDAQHAYTLTFLAPFSPAKWWQLSADAELFLIYFRGTLGESKAPASQPGVILSATNSFTLGHGWSAELNGTYHSLEYYAFQKVQAYGQLGAGVQKSLLDGRGTLRVSVADLLYTAPLRATSSYAVFQESFRSAQDTRYVTAAFSLRFGSNDVPQARKRATGAEDEKRRAAGQ